MNDAKLTKTLAAAVTKLLRPLVRILLRNSVPYGTFEEIARWVYADIAMREFGLQGRKPSVSRASIITGLSRKEIVRLQTLIRPEETAATAQYNRAANVISGWLRDSRFSDNAGKPRDLALDSDFAELVKSFSRDVPARAMLDELLRVGAALRLPDDRIRLLSRAYVPVADDLAQLEILGTDVQLLIATIDHNLRDGDNGPLFQRKVAYDNIPAESLPELRKISASNAQTFLEKMDQRFSKHDRDINPSIEGTDRKRAGIGVYYFEEDSNPSNSSGE